MSGSGETRFHYKTHILVLLTLGIGSSILSGFSFWYRSAVEQDLEAAYESHVQLADDLARLRARMREAGLFTELTLRSKAGTAKTERRRALERSRTILAELAARPFSPGLKIRLSELRSSFARLQEDEDRIIAAGRGDATATTEIKALSAALLERIALLGDCSTAELRVRRGGAQQALIKTFVMKSAAELMLVVLFACYLLYFLVRPVLEFGQRVEEWQLGRQWQMLSESAAPEVCDLSLKFAGMAERINAQYSRERDHKDFRTELVSLVSHEFANGLTIIKGCADTAADASARGKSREAGNLLRMIGPHVESLAASVDNLLNLGRIESAKFAVDMTSMDLSSCLRKMAALAAPLSRTKRLRFVLEPIPDDVFVNADASTLRLAVGNLISNAIKYTPRGGSVRVGAAEEDGGYRVFVADTGIGIDESDREKILMGHFRTEAGKEMTAKGFGIGLALARQIVEAHGSSLKVESEPGEGSVFSFHLRCASANSSRPVQEASA